MVHYYGGWGGWAPYVSVAERRRRTEKKIEKLRKKGEVIEPIKIEGRTIAKTYWGKAWCENLEAYSDFSNRLPRGRTYVRNGSVINLKIKEGSIVAMVSGSEIYEVTIKIAALTKKKWKEIVKKCSGKIDSLIELLQGAFSKNVMEVIACKGEGLFPHPKEIEMSCSCPDYATVCKHVAAVFYGVGARLDEKPELLFTLRQVDHSELIASEDAVEKLVQRDGERPAAPTFTGGELAELFGINVDAGGERSADEQQDATVLGVMLQDAAATKMKSKKAQVKKAQVKKAQVKKTEVKKTKQIEQIKPTDFIKKKKSMKTEKNKKTNKVKEVNKNSKVKKIKETKKANGAKGNKKLKIKAQAQAQAKIKIKDNQKNKVTKNIKKVNKSKKLKKS